MKNSSTSWRKIAAFIGMITLLTSGIQACKKKEVENIVGQSSMSMKINGEAWKAMVTTLHTDPMGEDEENPETYYVLVNGIDATSTDQEVSEAMGIYITIPASKFRNPKGTYPIIFKEMTPNNAWALFSSTNPKRPGHNYYPANATGTSGTVEITDFSIGQQSVFGQPIGKEGYTRLKGKFTIDLQAITGTDDRITITEGQFDLHTGIGIFN